MLAKHPDLVTARLSGHALSCRLHRSRRPVPEPHRGAAADAGRRCRSAPQATPPRRWRRRTSARIRPRGTQLRRSRGRRGDARRRRRRSTAWPHAPWVKEGWFQAYHLLRPGAQRRRATRKRADDALSRAHRRRVPATTAERINLRTRADRGADARLRPRRGRLPAAARVLQRRFLQRHRKHRVRLAVRIEFAGVRAHAQAQGFSVERLAAARHRRPRRRRPGIRSRASPMRPAAWSGRRSATMRSCRSPTTASGRPTAPRFRPTMSQPPRQSIRIPADALVPEPGTGRLVPVGAGTGAMAKVNYRISASAFHDGTEMEAADLVYPYALAYRWGGAAPGSATFDAEIAAATGLMRRAVQGRAHRAAWRKPSCRSPIWCSLSLADRRGLSRHRLRPTSRRTR